MNGIPRRSLGTRGKDEYGKNQGIRTQGAKRLHQGRDRVSQFLRNIRRQEHRAC